ncbi:MAG: hypothetical protein HYR91_03320 [Flavobacteriia bacterium]|nr:hypothetical protein [Flavobacteriia bacterium]
MLEKKNEENIEFTLSLIELDFHFDSLDGLIKIFENTSIIVHVFTTTKNIKLLSGIQYSSNIIFHPYKSFSKFLFLKKNKKIINDSKFIFINTIGSDFGSYLAIKKSKKIILRIHNINKQFNPNKSIVFPNSIFSLWKFTSYFFRQIIFKAYPIFRRIINSRVNYFVFPDNGLKDYALEQQYISPSKVINSIPLKIFNSSPIPNEYTNILQITIIGATDENRRNYTPIIEALNNIYSDDKTQIKIKLILLGKTDSEFGKKIISSLIAINNSNFSFKSFSTNVDEAEFIKYMNNSHLIISPIIQFAKNEIYREIYGKTKTTGSVLDFIKFGITTLIPDYYTAPKEMEKYMIKYSDGKSLANQIFQFYNNPSELNQLNHNAKSFVSKTYNKEEVLNQCLELIKFISKN